MSKHDVWLRAASDVGSFRRMYALASEIERCSDEAGLCKAASRVVQILACVIDKPIAPAEQLSEARRRFNVLLNYLVLIVDRELHNRPPIVSHNKSLEATRAPTREGRREEVWKARQGRITISARDSERGDAP
jgi:hypothetical protein